jgi:hypothetical protein
MVSIDEVTYRIERIASSTYRVVRVNDDATVGTFKTGKQVTVFPENFDPDLLAHIARTAVRQAKTSWVLHRRPSPPPVAPAAKPADEQAADAPPVSSRRGWAPA